MLDEIVVAAVEVLRELAGTDPDEAGWEGWEEELRYLLALFGQDLGAVLASDDQVEEVLFAFELVAVGSDLGAEGVGLDTDGSEGGDRGAAEVFVVGWEADLRIRFDRGADGRYDTMSLGAFFLVRIEHI